MTDQCAQAAGLLGFNGLKAWLLRRAIRARSKVDRLLDLGPDAAIETVEAALALAAGIALGDELGHQREIAPDCVVGIFLR